MLIAVLALGLLCIVTMFLVSCTSFGRSPRGERLEKMQSSPNFRDGKFQNRIPSQLNTTDTSSSQTMSNSFFQRVDELRPSNKIPAIKTDLNQLNREVDLLIWFGHSSFLIQVNGIRFLIDPVFIRGSPIFFVNRAFAGTNLYNPADIPEIDYLLIAHDHWDHLDYNTVITLKDRIKKVICGLGVGEHFEYWGFAEDTIVELDWNDEIALKKNIVVHALPARHFSGRALKSDMTLWVSFMIESSYLNIFISGDTGPLYIAYALKTPTVALFGSSSVEYYHIFRHNTIALQAQELSLKNLTVKEVLQAVRSILAPKLP